MVLTDIEELMFEHVHVSAPLLDSTNHEGCPHPCLPVVLVGIEQTHIHITKLPAKSKLLAGKVLGSRVHVKNLLVQKLCIQIGVCVWLVLVCV